MTRRVVLDSWAVRAVLDGHPTAGPFVEAAMDGGAALMSWINLGEVAYILQRRPGQAEAHARVQDAATAITWTPTSSPATRSSSVTRRPGDRLTFAVRRHHDRAGRRSHQVGGPPGMSTGTASLKPRAA